MKASDYIASFFSSQGVDTAFVVTGGGAMHLNDCLPSHQIFPATTFITNKLRQWLLKAMLG